MRRHVILPMLSLAGTLVLGCASLEERKAFEEHAAAARTEYVSADRSYGRQDSPVLNEESALSHYLAYAALNNPGLEAAFNSWKAALERIPQARSLPDPRFNYAYFIREVETRVGPQEQKVGIAQMFPWFGKLELRGDIALEAANAERQRYEAAKLKLFYRVKKAYYEYYYIGRETAITQENVQLLSDLEAVARTKYTAGVPTYAAMIKAQVELGKLEDQLLTLRDIVSPVVSELNAALNRPPNTPMPVPQTIPEDDVAFSNEQLLGWLKEGNPELMAADFMAAKDKAAIDLAKKDRFPDITVGLEYIDTDSALMPDTRNSSKDPVVGMLSINLPIWRDKYRAAEREARARYEAALRERKDRENNLVAKLQMVLYGFRDAERKIDLYRDTLVPKANQSFEVTQQAYEAGTVDFLDLIDAQRVLLDFRLSFERALANRAQKLAEIEMLVGREAPWNTGTSSSTDG
jgi:cobalt-zinc-cadmium efflux system outer membrane protein